MEIITSRANGLLMHLKKLATDRAYRAAQGEFLGDSPKLLAEALAWRVPLRAVACTAACELPPLPEGVRAVEVPADVMASVSPMKSPQGVIFSAAAPDTAPPETLPGRRYVLLDGVQDPGNVGTIWRTLDAFDFDGLLLLEGCADPYGVKTLRSSMGAAFRRPVYQLPAAALEGLLRRSNLPLYGTALRSDTVDVRTADLRRCAVAIGSEGRGLSQQVLSLCEKTLRIPMSARCESLNAAVAAAVVLWESCR